VARAIPLSARKLEMRRKTGPANRMRGIVERALFRHDLTGRNDGQIE
jgi:hypothetical protein